MRRNEAIKVSQLRNSIVTGLLVTFMVLNFAGCENALVEAAKAIQAETVTPSISIIMSDGAVLDIGGTVDFGVIALNETLDVVLTIKNSGKSNLIIPEDGITVSDSAPFTIDRQSAGSVAPGATVAVGISISGDAESTIISTLTITSNDVNIPQFSLKLAAVVSAYSRPDAPVNLLVTHPDPGNTTPEDWTQLVLTWPAVTSATDYEVQRDTYEFGDYATTFAVSGGATTTYTDTSCVPGTIYWYRVKSINHGLYSTFTSPIFHYPTLGTPVTGITANPASATMNILYPTTTLALAPVFSGSAPSITALSWSSSDPSVATVTDGMLTAAKMGTTTITMTSTDNTNISATCLITVSAHQVLYLANFGGNMDYDLIDPYAWTQSQVGNGVVGSGPSCTAVDASGKFLYESNAGLNTSALGIDGYAINQASGSLGFINGVYTGALTEGLVVASPNGPAGQQFVYCTFRSVGQVGAFAINNSTGVLSPLPIVVYHSDGSGGSGNPRWLTINPSGKNLYVSNSDIDKISMFSIEAATGVLTFVESYPTGDYPYKSAISADGKYLYVVNVIGDSVSAFSIDEAYGTLINVGTYTTGDNPTCVAIDPSSKNAYVTNAFDNTITAYLIDTGNGALAPINETVSNSSYVTWAYPNSVAIDLTGTYLVVASSNSNMATVYSIAAETGALTLKINFVTGLSPTHVAFQRLP